MYPAHKFLQDVRALAKGLIAGGLEPGDSVAVMSATRYEWTLVDFAIWFAGGVTVPVYETSSAGQVEWILHDAGARHVFAEDRDKVALIASVLETSTVLRDRLVSVVRMDFDGEAPDLASLSAAGMGVTDAELERHRTRRRPGRRRVPGLHLGHHRPPQRLRDHPRQFCARGRECGGFPARDPEAAACADPDVPALGPRAGPRCPGGLPPCRRNAGPRQQCCGSCLRTWGRSGRLSCWPCPGFSRRCARAPRIRRPWQEGHGSSGPPLQRPSATPPSRTMPPAVKAPGRASRCGRSMPFLTGSCMPGSATSSAAGWATLSPAPAPSHPTTRISSAVRGSRFWRATG